MKRLTKEQLKERDALIGRLRAKAEDISTRMGALQDAVEECNAAIGEYNDIVGEGKQWVEDVACSIQDFIDEKSEGWLEGDRGAAYSEWHDEYDNHDLSEMDEVALQERDAGSAEAADELEGLPEEPEL